MLCPTCGKNQAQKHPFYGLVECEVCQQSSSPVPRRGAEFTTDSIKQARKEYAADIVQPFRHGVLSKEYLDTYGTEGISVTKDEIKNAKNVWGDVPGVTNIDKTVRHRKDKNEAV